MSDGARAVRPRMMEIKAVVARHNCVTVADLESACRKKAFAWPRQIAQYLCREMTERSLPEIARVFGNRDHTSILFACRKVAVVASQSPELVEALDLYRSEIRELAEKRAATEGATRLALAPHYIPKPAPVLPLGSSTAWHPAPPRQTKGQKLAAIIDRASWLRLGGEVEAAS